MNVDQKEIIEALKVKPTIHPSEEVSIRKQFLKDYLKKTGLKGYVLGISGGQDSTLTGRIAQLAMEEYRQETGEEVTFIAVRLPYGEQVDEEDAAKAIEYIKPDQVFAVNIKKAVDASEEAFKEAVGKGMTDFNKGNTKARERMKAQYDIAAAFQCLVIGTDHAAEAVTGFYTKHGDGACDVAPLFGLNKRQGKELLRYLDAPSFIYEKIPTADLESDQPALPDEKALGVTYDEIDDFLEGKTIKEASKNNIVHRYITSEHKRQLPVTIHDNWWK